jgi:hypothetical protein|tara:strand:- start:416 stop:622 length:207 start_codon:yes stop_codon:yes gene_type:complete
MTKITFRKYMEMMHEAEERYGAIFESEISERDWNNPLIKDSEMPGLTLQWDLELQEWCVFGPLNQTVH